MTKKIVRLTESDLERIVRRVIKESMGVGFMSGEPNGLKIKKMETKEQSVGVPLKPVDTKSVIQKAMAMFPPVQWYNTIKGQEIDVADPNAVKAFNIARRFFDNKIPQLNANDDKFFQYVKQIGGGTTPGTMKYVHGMIDGTKKIYDILIPTLQVSNYPNTRPFQGVGGDNAVASASKVNPNISKLLQNYGRPASALYDEITKTS
jgi:hypothetical protein